MQLDFNEWFNSSYAYVARLPNIVFALIVFFVGWLVAGLIGKTVRRLLAKTEWDNKLFAYVQVDPKYKPELIIGKTVYYALMVYVVIAVFDILNLQVVAEPIVSMLSVIVRSIPDVLKAALILLFAWLLASVIKVVIQKSGKKLRLHRLLLRWKVVDSEAELEAALQSTGRIAFYVVLLAFLPGVLGALHIAAVSEPLSAMVGQFLQFVPKLFGAALTLLIGWLVAKIVRTIVTNFLKNIGTERLSERIGLHAVLQKTTLSSVIGTVVYILILIPILISALRTLEMNGISEPAIGMLNTVLTMIPNVIVGVVLVLAGVWIGRFVGQIVSGLLERIGFNSILRYLGLGNWEPTTVTASQIVGRLAQIVVILLFAVEALQVLRLQALVTLAIGLIAYLPSLFAAIAILAIGLFLGQLVQKLLSGVFQQKLVHIRLLAAAAKYTVIVLAFFMALDQLGIASSIVNAAFVLVLGGVALAFGLAFGLGGREFAAKWLERWQKPASSEAAESGNDPS